MTIKDIDFEEKRIHVIHQQQRTSDMKYIIEVSKTESGIRFVPMTEEVEKCFRGIIEKGWNPKTEPMVDGYAGISSAQRWQNPV